ncbi:MAG TPA: DUF4082 domain-containing protein [Puia sp.]|nr:DUF4082 domain-containing protein [Puia sp.]
MKTVIDFFYKICKKEFFTLPCLLLVISCSKEYSYEGGFTPEPVSIFTHQTPSTQTMNDNMGAIEVGTKFMSAIDGTVTGIKFYKTAGNTGTHTVQLYNWYGAPLATVVSMNESDSGWQTVLFPESVPIKANTMYVAAYHSSLGNYSATFYGLKTAITNGPLTALADSTLGLNGVFRYTDILDFPIFGFKSSNYWVDVLVVY